MPAEPNCAGGSNPGDLIVSGSVGPAGIRSVCSLYPPCIRRVLAQVDAGFLAAGGSRVCVIPTKYYDMAKVRLPLSREACGTRSKLPIFPLSIRPVEAWLWAKRRYIAAAPPRKSV